MRRVIWMAAAAAGFVLVLPLRGLSEDTGATSSSALDELRDLEKQAVKAIEAARRAFVFLEGGSGFLISPDGYLLTNAHVVAEAVFARRTELRVHLTGGEAVLADLKGSDPEGDVALLKLRGRVDAPCLELGDSESLRTGQRVIALGDPFLIASASLFLGRPPPDYVPSASLGIVSAVHRNSDTYTDAIQVDVAVNRANSGGPLITLDGKVVGINGKIETRFDTGVNTGVGYAIPANQIRRFLEPLKKADGGIVRHGVLLGLEVAERAAGKPGLPVTKVKREAPAEVAGFKVGDLIVSLDGLSVASRNRFEGILGTYPAGQQVLVKLLRGMDSVELKVALVEAGPLPYLGLTARTEEGPDGEFRILQIVPSSPAERAGLKVNDVILTFAGRKILSHTELELNLQARMAGDVVDVSLLRDGAPVDLKVRIGGQVKS